MRLNNANQAESLSSSLARWARFNNEITRRAVLTAQQDSASLERDNRLAKAATKRREEKKKKRSNVSPKVGQGRWRCDENSMLHLELNIVLAKIALHVSLSFENACPGREPAKLNGISSNVEIQLLSARTNLTDIWRRSELMMRSHLALTIRHVTCPRRYLCLLFRGSKIN